MSLSHKYELFSPRNLLKALSLQIAIGIEIAISPSGNR